MWPVRWIGIMNRVVKSGLVEGIRLGPLDFELRRIERHSGQYGADAAQHLPRAHFLLSGTSTDLDPVSERLHAALEYRFCIERLLFTSLYLVSGDGAITRAQEKLYTGSELRTAIIKVEKEFYQKLRFVDLCLEGFGLAVRTSKPDLDQLSEIHGRLGRYLHSQKRPDETTGSTEWIAEFDSLLTRCDQHLRETLAPNRPMASFHPSDDLYVKWRDGEVGDEEVVQIIRNEKNRKWR